MHHDTIKSVGCELNILMTSEVVVLGNCRTTLRVYDDRQVGPATWRTRRQPPAVQNAIVGESEVPVAPDNVRYPSLVDGDGGGVGRTIVAGNLAGMYPLSKREETPC